MSQEAQLMDRPAKTNAAAQADAPVASRGAYAFSPEVVMLSQPESARGEAVRTLRTHIMAQHVGDGRRGLAICAASSNVGASFTAVNLAVALAQIGVNVLLIDGDMRQPKVDHFIRPPAPAAGLRQLLEDEELDISAGIQGEVIENLSVMFAGGVTSSAQELLAKDRFSEIVDRCLRDYDMTIIDTPPANSCADARRISTVVGYSLIVAKRHHSFVGDIKALAGQLHDDRAKVVGTVMNEA